ncbi:EEV glycoprotein [Bovine papular stomatitis virus]
MGCCKVPNRQSVRSLKRASCPVATLVTMLSLVTSLGAIIKYTGFFLREACEDGWIPIKDICVLNTHHQSDTTRAHEICKYFKGTPPAIPNTSLLRGVMAVTGERHFWLGHHDKYSSIYEDAPFGRRVPYQNVEYDKRRHICLLSADGYIHHNCALNATVICVKKMYG